MARFFFNIRYKDDVIVPDREGVELDDDVNLRDCALYLVDRLRSGGGLAEMRFPECEIEINGAEGDVLLKVPVPAQ